jgi:16S rRNA (guanine966-N2)-methyltransferase
VIRKSVPQSKVLDLYAGSGAFGVEALSRGAGSAVFVDNSTKCINTIKSNLLALGEGPERACIVKSDAIRAIEKFQKARERFDIIFLDPPYYKGAAKKCLIKINACDILCGRGFVIAEHHKQDAVPSELSNMGLLRERRYGDTIISIYTQVNEEQSGLPRHL